MQKDGVILGVTEDERLGEGFLQLLLGDDSILIIRKEMWIPFDQRLKEGPIAASLKIQSKEIVELTFVSAEE